MRFSSGAREMYFRRGISFVVLVALSPLWGWRVSAQIPGLATSSTTTSTCPYASVWFALSRASMPSSVATLRASVSAPGAYSIVVALGSPRTRSRIAPVV